MSGLQTADELVSQLYVLAEGICLKLDEELESIRQFKPDTIAELENLVVKNEWFCSLGTIDSSFPSDVYSYIGKYYFMNREFHKAKINYQLAFNLAADDEQKQAQQVGLLRSKVELLLAYTSADFHSDSVGVKLVDGSRKALEYLDILSAPESLKTAYNVDKSRARLNMALGHALRKDHPLALETLRMAREGLDEVVDLDLIVEAEFPQWLIHAKQHNVELAAAVMADLWVKLTPDVLASDRFKAYRNNWISVVTDGADKAPELSALVTTLFARAALDEVPGRAISPSVGVATLDP